MPWKNWPRWTSCPNYAIVLASERRNTKKLLDEVFHSKEDLQAERRHVVLLIHSGAGAAKEAGLQTWVGRRAWASGNFQVLYFGVFLFVTILFYRIVYDPNLSSVVRQIALHCNLAAIIFSKSKMTKVDPYASNWLERFRHIKRFKGKVLKEQEEDSSGQIHDFTGTFWVFWSWKIVVFVLSFGARRVSPKLWTWLSWASEQL